MNITIINGNEKTTKSLPEQFNEQVRHDLIRRAVESVESKQRQAYGTHPLAGKRFAVKLSRRRRDYKASYGKGMSRIPRKAMSRNGSNIQYVGAFAPGTVGGMQAHPPRSEKVLVKELNKKERRKAIRSAMAASVSKECVENRGHKLPQTYPLAVNAAAEALDTTQKAVKLLEDLGLQQELARSSVKKIRPGKGKGRNRPYKKRKGPLIVVSKQCPLIKAASNIPGVDVVIARNLNAKALAPGGHPGRLTIYTDTAIDAIKKEGMFK